MFTGEIHDQRPSVDNVWEEVVEVSFRPESRQVALVQWAGEATWPLHLEQIDYRVRYCASGLDAAADQDGELAFDRYLLQFWAQPPAPDAVLRQTSQSAAYWHQRARTLARA